MAHHGVGDPAHILDGDVVAALEGRPHLRAEDQELARTRACTPADPLREEGQRVAGADAGAARDREAVVEDVVGDRRRGLSTLALVAGPRRAAAVAVSSSAVLMVVTLLPWVMEIYGLPYLVAIGVMDALLVLVAFKMIRSGGRLTDQRLSRTLTMGMLLGLLAIVLGESL